jgi:hypothetical protein
LQAQSAGSALTGDELAGVTAGELGFDLVNFTGSTLRAVYISSSESKGWEENIFGESEMPDGVTTDIRFSPEEKSALWDIRIESTDGHYTEWKNLNLRGASRITLLLNLAGELAVVAEIE